jgi:meso-butanediol dehydrogenase / (S,S)-butanediol dehydrogenase / diacetyl reductase
MVQPVVVVTGAASGIGRATAELYAERGYRVVAVDVNEYGLKELAALDGETFATLVGDVSSEAVNEAMVGLALQRFGRLDAAVLNAGIGGAGPLESAGALERFDRVLAVNVRGVAAGIRASVPALRAVGGGSIVVTSSISGLRGDPGVWGYNASKAASINLVRAAALDYAAENIRINAIAPGGAITGMTAGVLADPQTAAVLTARIPLRRWSDAREQAEVIWFLTSPAASFITGVTLPVDGGIIASTGILPPPGRPGE